MSDTDAVDINSLIPKKSYENNVQPRLQEITGWLRENLPFAEIARKCGVTSATLLNYRKKHPELVQAMLEGLRDVIPAADEACLKLATGRYVTSKVERKYERDADGVEQCTERKVTVQEHLPSVRALALLYQRYDLLSSGGGMSNPRAMPRSNAPEPDRTQMTGPPPLQIISYNDPDYIDAEFTDVTGTDDIRTNQTAE
ncbi:MAG: hypothetical protein AB7C95_00855 [Synergistaceae bacterium]